jgi:hypothetical protein
MKPARLQSALTALLLAAGLSATAEEIELILVAGQSNAQGWKGDASKFTARPEIDDQIPMYYVFPEGKGETSKENKSNGWETLGPQVGRFPNGHFGPEVQLAREVYNAGRHPAVFKYSKGATSLCGAWKGEGDGKLTDGMLTHLQQALQLLQNEGHTVHVGAFVWIQGESDSRGANREKYAAAFRSLVSSLEKATGETDFPILLGIDEQHPATAAKPAILEHHQEYAKQHANAEFTSMLGLEKADATHLTPAGLIEHGKVLYSAYQKLNP